SDLNAHPYIRQIKAIISGFIKIIKKDAITIRSLQQLLKYEDETLIQFFNSNNIKQGDVNKLRIQCGNYEEKLAQLHHFYTQFCPVEKIKGVDVYLKDMEQRSKCDTLTLQETLANNHWEYHKINENAAKLTYKLANLQTFRNIFNQKINSEEEINIEELAQNIIPSLAQIYEQKTMKYKTNEWEILYCIEESTFWNNVKDVKAELDFMNLKADKRLIKTLTYVSRYPIYVERLQQLNEVVSMFKVTHTKEDWIETQLALLNGNYLWLGRLNDFFEYHDRSLSSLNENCWELIKSLSLADEFIRFLQSVAEHDITNIINGVDNQSDERLIQEDTVSSLIQVKKFLLPLLKNVESLKPKTFLKKLCEITEQNPVLGQKITLCNSNRKALENMYKNINNRTEVTQERIINAVKIGTYTFKRISNDDKCTATLSYPINSFSANSDSMDDKDESNEKPYTLNDLQDLRGRALLIAKPGVTIEMEMPEKEQEQQERAKKIMNEFVIQVDFAQEIINVGSKLIQIGIVDRAQKEHYYLTFFPARHILAFHDYFNDNAKDKAANHEECQILITFVNNAARLPPPKSQTQMEIIDDIHDNTRDYYSALCSIGSKLADIFENIPKQIREIKDTGERIKSDLVQPGKLFVAACSNKSLVPNIIMSLYANHKSYPQPWQILICTSSTTMEELSIFTKRCFFASDNGYKGHLFCIANLELVDFELQYNLVNNIRSMNRMPNIKDKYLLALICCKESEVQHHILDQFSQDIHVTNGLDVDAMKGIYQELCPDVRRVSSELSGQGKTEWIKNASFEKMKIPRSFLISDGVDFGALVRRLKEHKIRPVESLHLNIVSADNPGDVNLFLFELLTLGMVSNYTDIVCLPNTPIFIEVATTVGQYLLKSLPFVECLSSEHITWDISNLSVSLEIDNPIQIVCHYLEADENSTIEEKDLLFNTTGTDITEPLQENRCRELIKKYLFDDKDDSDISSYRFVEIFINVLANQLIGLSLSSYFRVDNLKLMTKEKDIRKTLVNTLLIACKDFATRSVKTKAAQLESITPLNDDRLGTIVQWEDSNHLLVFFLSQAPDSICALYRNAKKVPDNVTKLLQSQCINGDPKNFKLEDYNTMDMKLLLKKLESLARKTTHEITYPRYALSADNLIKMALILLRARASIPTSLIGFLAGVVEVKFHALNLHAGISEDIIKSFMTMVQDESQEKETWIFFDEINTCNYMGLLSDLIAHRRWLGKEVHYNIRIFAACNPYRKRTKSQSSVGLKVQQKIKYEERNELVYQVKPLPDQILDYVWDYGILQALEEEKYIQTMVSESLGEYDDNNVFAKLLAESQRYIRHIEEPYSVSLRDVKRAITLQSIRQTYREKMARLLLTNGIQFDDAKFNTVIRQEQEDYINRMICPPNTAHNEALLENVLVYLIPYQGSSSSTSDGIIKVFEKAVNYQNTSSKEFKIISVVLLDEVLHSLLEPSYPSDGPTVAFIGISNWRLDNSKSNTAVNLLGSKTNPGGSKITSSSLKPLADAYSSYEQTGQLLPNFHGLRDYYALVKSLSLAELTPQNIQKSLVRNFGGTDPEQTQKLCEHYFGEVFRLSNDAKNWEYTPVPVEELINANLDDEGARHLMVIGKSDSIVSLLTYQLRSRNLDPVIILGSQFPDDRDDYSYTGRPLILTDLEIIYGSLYDLWNQNYIVVADPPLLNRFEKQKMTINNILTPQNIQIVEQLSSWVNQMSKVFGGLNPAMPIMEFKQKDLFIGFDPDETLQSLVIDITKRYPNSDDADILQKCKEKLIAIASSDGIIRAEKSGLDADEIKFWKNTYYNDQCHNDLATYIQSSLNKLKNENYSEGLQVIINTFSNINTDVEACLKDTINCQVDKLSTFKTEAQLQNRVKHFWLNSTAEMLILQCDVTTISAGCIKLAKFIIEQFKNDYMIKKKTRPELKMKTKHSCVILHIHRKQENSLATFNFMCGWDQITIETLSEQEIPLSKLLDRSLNDVINTTYKFEDILKQELLCWQYDVASNKKLLYRYPSFLAALQAYIKGFVRRPIAKALCALERFAATKTFFLIDKPNISNEDNYLLNFWLEMFNDQKIINIEEISEPSPDLYTMPLGIYDLQFPFSYYFMEQIDNFRPIYQEEVNILYQNPDNVNNLSGELEDSVINEYLKNFTEKIRAEVPLLKTSPLDKASDLYFKDFVSVIACNEPGNKDPELLGSIFERRLGKEKVLNPIILHTYWWIHGNSIMAELQLAQICPTIAPELKNKSGDAITLVKEAIEILLVKISKDKNMNEAYEQKEVDRWKYEVTKVLSFSKEIPKASTLESLKLLQFCNDLLSIKSIRPHSISRIISLAQNSVSTLTIEVLNVLFDVLYEIEPTEINLVFKRNIILRCLDIIPLESDLRIWLYRRLFENQPFPLMGIIIQKIFETEKTAQEGIFFQLIKGQPGILTFYPRLQEIDKYLTELDLKMATLCCDIIQHCFFAKTTIEKLVSYFPHALRTLCEEEIQPLQRISAVAFLKEFVRMFFDVVINDENASVAYQLDSIQGINGTNFLHKIIEALKVDHSLIYSLRIYFLRDLRRRGYSFDEVRRFCKRRPDELPWLNNFPWESSDSTRFPFNPYWHLSEYPETEIAYANMRRIGNKVQIDDFLKKVDGGSINSRLSLIGLLVMRLHAVRASRGWDEKERELSIHLKSKIDNMISLPDAYRQMVSKLLENTHNLYKIGTDTTSNNLIMKSVLIYIVGLHASMNSDFSPLTAYLQEIEGCGSMFIVSCQSDEESALFNAVAAMGGGSHHQSAPGNTRLDQDIVLSVVSNDQAGYVSEKLESSQTHTVRAMCPTSYRILHLIVHTLILASTPSEATNNFFKQNGNTYGDVTDYCMKHIENDWAVLKKLLNISDENLALLFHSILVEIINNPNHSKPNHLFTSVARQQWETNFARNYVTPLINNVTQTIRDFSTSLRNAMTAAEVSSNILDTEISQTLDMSPQHCKEYLPGLWRTLGTVCYESLNAYYSRDMHHNVQAFPFLAVYFKHEKNLSQIKHLYPIVNFVKILHSNLAYRLQREKAVSYTFKEFIDESKNEAMFDTRMTLNTAFEEFANAWNSVIDNVTRYQCHELPRHPQITINDSVTFGLMEARDSGVFLCAIIDYLVDLHNNFLEDVIAIPERSCLSLKFLEEATPWVYEEIVTSTQVRVTKATNPYHIPSKRLDSIKRSNIVDYEWDNRILRYSQHNLKIGHGEDIMFDLQAIEMELAQTLVSEKAYIERNGDQLLMDKFPYHLELFQSSMRILGEIKELIPQEPIPNDKISLIFESASSAPLTSNPFKNANILAKYSIENATELLSFLEIFLCFIKRISADNGETLMKEFVNQWLKLSNLMENIGFQHILNLELKLKHAISLYELVENQVANEEIKYLNTKYKKSLDEDMKNQVLEAIDFEQNTGEQKQKIPAEAFVIALKRYMQRFLCTDNIKASDPLNIYVNDMSLNLWPDGVPEELLDDVFPDSLLVENTFEAYEFVNNMIKVDQQSLPAVKQITPIELDNSMEVDHPGVD
ncbi:12597_t:CDS:10, partial [Racocetra fulgida]